MQLVPFGVIVTFELSTLQVTFLFVAVEGVITAFITFELPNVISTEDGKLTLVTFVSPVVPPTVTEHIADKLFLVFTVISQVPFLIAYLYTIYVLEICMLDHALFLIRRKNHFWYY